MESYKPTNEDYQQLRNKPVSDPARTALKAQRLSYPIDVGFIWEGNEIHVNFDPDVFYWRPPESADELAQPYLSGFSLDRVDEEIEIPVLAITSVKPLYRRLTCIVSPLDLIVEGETLPPARVKCDWCQAQVDYYGEGYTKLPELVSVLDCSCSHS